MCSETYVDKLIATKTFVFCANFGHSSTLYNGGEKSIEREREERERERGGGEEDKERRKKDSVPFCRQMLPVPLHLSVVA